MKSIERVLLVFLVFVFLTACGTANQTSDLLIRYGEEVPESSYPGVEFLGGCTGTFVSSTTLITAKHCVGRPDSNGRVWSMERLPRLGDIRSEKVFAHPRGSGCCTKHDIAVAIFPEGTAPDVFEIDFGPLAEGDDLLMVGFGGRQGDPTAGPFGVKRRGTNQIAELDAGMIETHMPDGSGLAPGDSGGPLFRDQKLIGVASSGDGRTWSRHVAMNNDAALWLLNIAVDGGADIPGMPE